MSPSNSDQELKARNNAALDLSRNTGAFIKHSHLERSQEVFPVTKDDLEDIGSFDTLATLFLSLGMFLTSGAGWLLVEKWLEASDFKLTPLTSFCTACLLFGLLSFAIGTILGKRKRKKIRRIFEQSKPINRRPA